MISERRFVTAYTSFWNQVLPRIDSYLRRINCSCERYNSEVPVLSSLHRDRRGIVNELGFRLFREASRDRLLSNKHIAEIAETARQYVERLSNAGDSVVKDPVVEEEIRESMALAESLKRFFKGTRVSELVFWPEFPGCGMLGAAKGDIIHGPRLFEVKAGDRSFRVTDIRQILTYCCLDFGAKKYGIKEVVLLNPRRGTHFTTSTREIVRECAGMTPVEFFFTVIEFLSSEPRSR